MEINILIYYKIIFDKEIKVNVIPLQNKPLQEHQQQK